MSAYVVTFDPTLAMVLKLDPSVERWITYPASVRPMAFQPKAIWLDAMLVNASPDTGGSGVPEVVNENGAELMPLAVMTRG